MFKTLLENIPVLVVTVIATITGGTAVSKIAGELQPLGAANERQIQEISNVITTREPTLTVTSTPTSLVTSTGTPIPTSKTTTTTASGKSFTLAELATHNTKNSCYVAFNKTVYDVSTNPSWQNCRHHGISGGSDITSRFPHSTSYLATLQKVGTLTGGASSSNSGNTSDSDDDDENENEDEHEDENEIENEREDD